MLTYTPFRARVLVIPIRRALPVQLLVDVVRTTAGGLPVRPQTGRAYVILAAFLANERPLVGVQPLVQLEVHELRKLGGTEVARVRLLPAVQPQVRLQVGRRGEALLADAALVGTLPGVHQVVLLEVGQLREGLGAHVALKRALTAVGAEMYLLGVKIIIRMVTLCMLMLYCDQILHQRN